MILKYPTNLKYEALAAKTVEFINCTNYHLLSFKVRHEIQGIMFPVAEKVIFNGCDYDFITHWSDKKIFPKAIIVYDRYDDLDSRLIRLWTQMIMCSLVIILIYVPYRVLCSSYD